MQLQFFTLPIESVADYTDEINTFLRANKVVEIQKQLIQTANGVFWCLCISYIATNTGYMPIREKIDYLKVLDEDTFKRFSKLREIRKKIASGDGVSAYVVFTDAELAEIAKLPELSVKNLKEIKGIGDKKSEKYGEAMIKMFNGEQNETGDKPDTKDSLF